MVLCSAFLFLTLSSKAQTVDPVTGNLITGTWQGTTPANGYGGFSGGHMPGYIANQKAIVFGYNQGTASQSIGVAAALSNAGSGIELKGYNYSWYYYNNDSNRGSLTGNIRLTGPGGNVLESYNYNMPQTGIGNWIQQSGSQLFTNQYQISQVSSLDVSFTGKDDRWWAGYYGPAIKSVNVNLTYGVNPCATNPAYSPNCAGFNDVITSPNLVPNPNGYAVFGDSINQSYAINTALASAGSAASIHGFQWGYIANANGPYCALWILVCFDERTPSVSTNVNITNSSGASLYNVTRNYQNSYNNTNYSYLFPSSQQMSTLGNFNFTASTNDQAYVGGMYSRAIYTVDPCVANPMSSPTCKGYYEALAKLTTPTVVADSPAQAAVVDTSPVIVESYVAAPSTSYNQTSSSPTTTAGSTQTETSTSSQQSSPVSTGSPVAGPVQQASVAQTAPSSTQTKVGEVSDSSGSSKSTVSLSSVLSMIGSNQEKTAALEKSVVQAADAQAFSAGETAKQTAEKVAGEAQSQSITSGGSQASTLAQTSGTQSSSGPMQNSGLSIQGNLQSNTMLNATRLEQSIASSSTSQSYSGSSSGSTLLQNNQGDNRQDVAVNAPPVVAYVPKTDFGNKAENNYVVQQPKYEPPQTIESMGLQVPGVSVGRTTFENKQDTSVNSMVSVLPPARYEQPKFDNTLSIGTQTFQYQPPVFRQDAMVAMVSTPVISYNVMPPTKPQQALVEAPALEGIKFGGNKNPVESAIEARPILLQTTTTQQMDNLRKNVQNNELAGGVTIELIAKQPTNYAQYFTMIPDAAFYAPKEIYKNQKTIDNERAFRSLGSDRLHQQMIDQQYR